MKKLLLHLILSFFSTQSFAGSCPDGSEPVKSVSDDGTYFVYNCGGSATSSSEISKKTTTSVKVKPTELEMFTKFVGEFNLKKLSENPNPNLGMMNTNSFKFDINQDGHDDLIVGITTFNTDDRNQPNEFSKPVILFWDNNIKEYVVDEDVQKALPFLYFPRRIHGSINPKNGLTHLFIGDTGFDLAGYDFSSPNLPPNCGAQNHLITYDPSTGKVAEIQLPKLWDYTHALAATDMNGDQITDYVVLNSPYIKYPQKCLFNGADYTNGNYILYSNKNSGFDKVNINLNYKGYSKTPTITSGIAIVDENNDTFLLLGSEDPGDSIYALKKDSKTSFTETSRINAPAIMRSDGRSGAYSEVLYADVDGDGTKEVVASINTSNWTGRYIQLLDFSNGELRDRSEDVVQSNPASEDSNDWCRHLYFNEQTSWGQPILTCNNGTYQLDKGRGSLYTWTDNKLQPAKIKAINLTNWIRSIYPVTIDQKTVFVGQELTGQRKVNGHSFYDVKVFYLMKPPMSEAELPVVGSEISNSFDGRYRFDVFRHNDGEGAMLLGGGYIEIKNGEMIIEKDKRYLKTGPKDLYDTFSGQINEKGKVSGSVELAYLFGKDRSEVFTLNGQIDKKIWGDSPREDFFRVYMLLVKE